MAIEREKKYLISLSAKWLIIKEGRFGATIQQGYIVTGDTEVRVRLSDLWPPKLTIKRGSGEVRTEVEMKVAEEHAAALWTLVTHSVEKVRYTIGRWEIDIFTKPEDLILAEIELDYEGEEVAMPEWLPMYVIRDVTDDPQFKNQNLVQAVAI